MVEAETITALGVAIAREFKPHLIILFGSYAYGQPHEGSDVDLLVVLPFTGKPSQKAIEILHKVKPQIPVELIVRTPEQVQARVAGNDWFMREIIEKGRRLYESADARVGE
jgi:predicted nucleotidyltransferase